MNKIIFYKKERKKILHIHVNLTNFRYIGDTHKLALLLDYDGTLAPIAPHPDLAVIPTETKNILQRLSNITDVYIAIISGRNVENVNKMVRRRFPERVMQIFILLHNILGRYRRNNVRRQPRIGNFAPRWNKIRPSHAHAIPGKSRRSPEEPSGTDVPGRRLGRK